MYFNKNEFIVRNLIEILFFGYGKCHLCVWFNDFIFLPEEFCSVLSSESLACCSSTGLIIVDILVLVSNGNRMMPGTSNPFPLKDEQ